MVESPELTVAVPTYNGSRHLGEALRSVLAQRSASFDLVVSDDRSEDDTLAVVQREAGDRARVEVNSERLGLAGNWNRCVVLARTPLVSIFHQDDVMRPGHLAAHLGAFRANRDLGFVASAADVIDDDGRDVSSRVVGRGHLWASDEVYPPGSFVAELAVENPLRCSAVTLLAAAHAEAGGFDPTFRYVVDWDFWIRVARRRSVSWLGRPTVAVRWHAASETHRFKTGMADLDETIRLLDELYTKQAHGLPAATELRRRANQRVARAFLNRAYEAAVAGDRTLERRCLRRSVQLWPGVLGRLALDPRLLLRLVLGVRSSSPPKPRAT